MASDSTVMIVEPGREPFALPVASFQGAPSTLCKGCGHNSITAALIDACKAAGVNPYRTVKVSGIGCSSKTPAYFLRASHGFNSLHGRMPSVATGAALANRTLRVLGVSGDGDTANIGFGQFKHACRRDVPMLYLVENNGCYGLTKGQFSATAAKGAALRRADGEANPAAPLDLCLEALIAGASFIARSFAGDRKQLVRLIEAALHHRGTALLDIISPCVTFNDFEGSTKGWEWSKAHEEPLHELAIAREDAITPEVEQAEGGVSRVTLHDGTVLLLRALRRGDHDVRDRAAAARLLMESQARDEFLTGLIYVDPEAEDFVARQDLVDEPLATLPDAALRPGRDALEEIVDSF